MNICSKSYGQFAEIAADVRLRDRLGTLTYRIPEQLIGRLAIGQLVWVSLRQKLSLGIVVEIHDREPPGKFEVKDIQSLVEPTFRLSSIQWNLAAWVANETVSSFFEAASLMLPPGVSTSTVIHLQLVKRPDRDERERFTRTQLKLIDYLAERETVTLDAARKALDTSLNSVIPALEKRDIIRREARVRTPQQPKIANRLQVRLLAEQPTPPSIAPKQVEAHSWLSGRLRTRDPQVMLLDDILESTEISRQTIKALEQRGSIKLEPVAAEVTSVAQLQRPSNLRLTPEQQSVWEQLEECRRERRQTKFLLHGVTGSGKTEIYFRLVASAFATGKSAILLVPEIGLAGQIIERARKRFGDRALVLHSGLNSSERYRNWYRAATGEPVLIVGARSALFAPLPDIGVIILDEEHELAYKQDNPPRYHARYVAEKLADLHEARLILGSATPDVETYFRSERSDWRLLEMQQRVGQRVVNFSGDIQPRPIPLPWVKIVDMRDELRSGNHSIFSDILTRLVQSRIDAGEQAIMFLNRRGMSTIVQCRSCGTVRECPLCDIPLVYHRIPGRIICHRCGHREQPPPTCANCGSESIGYFGTGTQRVEFEIANHFPEASVMRWDQDALRGGVHHEDLLARADSEDVDIIVGTQMVAKGLDLPRVTAVGVINADTYLHLPDFRSAERTFQMLSQVAGRAGRRAAGGEVVIQTFTPNHYSIVNAASHDYSTFYDAEIAFRRQHGYPPFKRLVRLLYRHADEGQAEQAALDLSNRIERYLVEYDNFSGIDLIGPAPAFSARVRGKYGWQIVLRGEQSPVFLGELDIPWGWIVDVDPVNML